MAIDHGINDLLAAAFPSIEADTVQVEGTFLASASGLSTISGEGAVRDRTETDDRLVIFTLWLVVFSIASQAIIIAPIIPTMARQLNVDEASLGTLITAYAVAVGSFRSSRARFRTTLAVAECYWSAQRC